MPSTLRRVLSAVLAALAGAGCALFAGAEPPTLNPVPITDQRRASAMISIHAHARYFSLSPGVISLVMPLPEAIQILHDDEGLAADSRRRRAAAKLAAYWLHRFDWEDFDEEIEQIGGPAAVHAIETYVGSVGLNSLPPPAVIEVTILNLLKLLTPLCPFMAKPVDENDGVRTPPPIEWWFELLVPRSIGDIARAFDPQSWNECSVLFWASHLVETPSCCPHTDTSNCSCALDSAGDPKPIDPPYPRGMPYSMALYEHFCHDERGECQLCDSVSCDMSFENLLCVTTAYTPPIVSSDQLGTVDRYDVDYHLGQSRAGELTQGEGYLLDSDEGNLHVREPTTDEMAGLGLGTWSVVHSDKHMTFIGTGMTTEVGQLLQAFEDELRGELAEHACCWVKPEKWGTNLSELFKLLEKKLRLKLPPYRNPIPPLR